MLRNVSGQKWRVYAYDRTTGEPKTGDAANISARITKDFGTPAATDDAAPTEVDSTNEPGYYDFTILQAESNAHTVSLSTKSSTADITVIACPPVQNPIPQYLSLLGIESDGDLTKVNTLHGHTAQTGDSYARIGATGSGLTSLATASALTTVDTVVDGIKAVTDNLPNSGALTSLATAAALTTVDGVVDAIKAATDKLDDTLEDDSGTYRFTANALEQAPSGGGDATGANQTTIIGHLTDIKGATFNGTTDSLEALRDRGDSAWVTATGFSTHSAADVWAVTTRTITAFSFNVTLAASQPNYAPAKAGDEMDLVDALNVTAVAAIQNGLSTYDGSDTSGTTTLLSRLSSARAGYLDKLNVSGTLAHSDAANTYKADVSSLATSAEIAALEDHGDSMWATADVSGLSTFNPATDTVASVTTVGSVSGSVGSVTASVTVGTNNDKTGYSLTTAPPTATEVADAVLSRDASNVEGSAGEHSLCTVILASQESSVSGTSWTIRKTDGTTYLVKTVTTDGDAEPIVGVD